VLRKVVGNAWDTNAEKLAPNWEGPGSILSTRYGGVTTSPAMECTKLEKVLSLSM